MTEASKLDHSIEHLKTKLDDLYRVKELVTELEKTGDVDISNPKDSGIIQIVTTQDEPTGDMQELADLRMVTNRIKYIHENDVYRLKVTIRE